MSTSVQHIWLVDDDDDDLVLMELAFRKAAPNVFTTRLQDGEDFLALLQQSAVPDLVILDLNMIRLNGFQTLLALRAEGNFKKIPVVMLTTSSNPADEHQSTFLGTNAYFTKPDRFDELASLAGRLVQEWLPR